MAFAASRMLGRLGASARKSALSPRMAMCKWGIVLDWAGGIGHGVGRLALVLKA